MKVLENPGSDETETGVVERVVEDRVERGEEKDDEVALNRMTQESEWDGLNPDCRRIVT